MKKRLETLEEKAREADSQHPDLVALFKNWVNARQAGDEGRAFRIREAAEPLMKDAPTLRLHGPADANIIDWRLFDRANWLPEAKKEEYRNG